MAKNQDEFNIYVNASSRLTLEKIKRRNRMSEESNIRDIAGLNDIYSDKYGMSLVEAQLEMKRVNDPDFNNGKTKLASKIVNIEASRIIIATKALKEEQQAITKDIDNEFVEGFAETKDALLIQRESLETREKVIKKQLRRLIEMKARRDRKYDEHKDKDCQRALKEIKSKIKEIESKMLRS